MLWNNKITNIDLRPKNCGSRSQRVKIFGFGQKAGPLIDLWKDRIFIISKRFFRIKQTTVTTIHMDVNKMVKKSYLFRVLSKAKPFDWSRRFQFFGFSCHSFLSNCYFIISYYSIILVKTYQQLTKMSPYRACSGYFLICWSFW